MIPVVLFFLAFSWLVASGSASEGRENYIIMFRRPPSSSRVSTLESEVYESGFDENMRVLREGDVLVGRLRNGYVAKLSEDTLKDVRGLKSVEVVEKDRAVSLSAIGSDETFEAREWARMTSGGGTVVQMNAPWGISRVSSKGQSILGFYEYPESAGFGVTVYVIDTGVDVNNPELRGRARWGANLVKGSPDDDENGHGTHCAGTIAGRNTGMAKEAEVVAVKVLNRNGRGLVSQVVLGIDHVIQEHERELNRRVDRQRMKFMEDVKGYKIRRRAALDDAEAAEHTGTQAGANFKERVSDDMDKLSQKEDEFMKSLERYIKEDVAMPKTVVNMSIGGVKSRALDFSVDYALRVGIHFSVAAGNSHDDACLYSPSSSRDAVTVGASGMENEIAYFSNFGECVDLFAPGVAIFSTWKNGDFRIASGTSMAAPHVSGAMALYLGEHDFTPKELKKQILNDAKKVINTGKRGSMYFPPYGAAENLPLLSTSNLIRRVKENVYGSEEADEFQISVN